MLQLSRHWLLLPALFALATAFGVAAAQTGKPLLQFDFNAPNPWPDAAADVMPSTPIDVLTSYEIQPVGVAATGEAARPSGAWVLKTEVGKVNLPWMATYSSGWLLNGARDATGKLEFALDLWASSAKPITLRLESFDAKKHRTGGLQTTLQAQKPATFEHLALDLAAMKPEGAGKFSAADPFLQLFFSIENPAWPDNGAHEVRIDNLRLAAAP